MSVSFIVVEDASNVAELFGGVSRLPIIVVNRLPLRRATVQVAGYGVAVEFVTKSVDFERLQAQLGQLPSTPH